MEPSQLSEGPKTFPEKPVSLSFAIINALVFIFGLVLLKVASSLIPNNYSNANIISIVGFVFFITNVISIVMAVRTSRKYKVLGIFLIIVGVLLLLIIGVGQGLGD